MAQSRPAMQATSLPVPLLPNPTVPWRLHVLMSPGVSSLRERTDSAIEKRHGVGVGSHVLEPQRWGPGHGHRR